ncbi:ClpXP adapter SpxH family protein [Rossellomorea marisflavi]|uniref:ClpXP adapter protein SpxH n=2 Tax=Rossellomorea marisflavi TaxID=189381 RepID=A0A0J5SPN5_9BACI|nr:ClpXP adapter SpxH family protein [Rossellomorea marisflavi]KMK96776.1 dithiol-disulfide isomerase [Rossellomorea marisflavi]KML06183.1 dithiol-disulfide isomerase [Rossellomorea marisflavi]KZE49549.1 dithiol-disulfide isomerase [Rossellomorea marisflavi]MCM2603782.1 DsbA family protein [Rossellomorea marisflavi]
MNGSRVTLTSVNWHPLKGCSADKKPLEIYMFVDPLCPECWALEPIMKKLHIEYGQYFRIRYILSGQLSSLNIATRRKQADLAQHWDKTASRSGMSCDGSLWKENPIDSPYVVSFAIKAAELQGKHQGIRFLRCLQERLFLEKRDVSSIDVLKECAKAAKLDLNEFMNDIHSDSAAKAFKCDVKITSEMEVEEIPTLVFFNENIEDEGLKIAGMYPYDVYVHIIEEMLAEKPEKQTLPSLDVFMKHYRLVGTMEIAVVYDLSVEEVEKEMKKWALQQKVKKIPAKHGTFWRYIG